MKSSDNSDRNRLLHIREAAEKALTFIKGKKRASLDDDEVLVFALIRAFTVIGEAATHVSGEFQRLIRKSRGH